VFPGEGTFHVVADYDAKTCTVTPGPNNVGNVVTAPSFKPEFVDPVMKTTVRFFTKEVGVYGENHLAITCLYIYIYMYSYIYIAISLYI